MAQTVRLLAEVIMKMKKLVYYSIFREAWGHILQTLQRERWWKKDKSVKYLILPNCLPNEAWGNVLITAAQHDISWTNITVIANAALTFIPKNATVDDKHALEVQSSVFS